MKEFLVGFMLIGYIMSITVLTAMAVIGADSAHDPVNAVYGVLAAVLINIVAFVIAVDINRQRGIHRLPQDVQDKLERLDKLSKL